MKKLVKNILFWFISFIIFEAIFDFVIKIENTIGISIVAYPIICVFISIIKNIKKYFNGEFVFINPIYKASLSMAIISNFVENPSILKLMHAERTIKMVDSIAEKKDSKRNMIFNILLNIVIISILILLVWPGTAHRFTIMVILFGVLLVLFLVTGARGIYKRKMQYVAEIKEEIKTMEESMSESERKKYNTRKFGVILLLIIIFIVIPVIAGIIMTESEISKYGFNKIESKDYEFEQKDINVKDDDYQETDISEKDEENIKNLIKKELGGDIVYKVVQIQQNQKNVNNERYNEITVVANLESDSDDAYSYDFIFYKYLTESDVHEKGELETYMFWKTEQIKKQDWYSE